MKITQTLHQHTRCITFSTGPHEFVLLMFYLPVLGLGIVSLSHLLLVSKQNFCTILMFCQQLMEQWFAASVGILAHLSMALVMHKPLYLVVPGMSGCPLLLARKMYLERPFTREKIIKFIVYSICNCLTCSLVYFCVVTGIIIMWHINFNFAGIKIIWCVHFVFAQPTFIWLCLWILVCSAILTATCLIGESNFLWVVFFIACCLMHNSYYAKQFYIWHPQ